MARDRSNLVDDRLISECSTLADKLLGLSCKLLTQLYTYTYSVYGTHGTACYILVLCNRMQYAHACMHSCGNSIDVL